MPETAVKTEIINPTEVCYKAFGLMQTKNLDEAEKLLSNCLLKVEDPVARGLFHSSLGILYKMKGDFKTAWRHYKRAEKLIPSDPALKIISARLLIDEFAEFDQAVKKARKVLTLIPNNPVFKHQAYITMGLAYVKKGDKKKSIEMLIKAMEGDFQGFITTKNIDFNLCEAILKKEWAEKEVKEFLDKACKFAELHEENDWLETIQKMLTAFPKTG
jgi:tetratricopeptide (TPR) repeat protein